MAAKSILLVDDNEAHQYALGKHLATCGFEVFHAETGAEALSLAIANQPSVVLLDINLPDLTGFEVCEALKGDASTRSIPVVFHSATYDTASARSRAWELGAESFLTYPINFDHLVSVLNGVIARTTSGTEGRGGSVPGELPGS